MNVSKHACMRAACMIRARACLYQLEDVYVHLERPVVIFPAAFEVPDGSAHRTRLRGKENDANSRAKLLT